MTEKRRMTTREKAAWRYLTKVVLLWLFGLGGVGSVLGALVTGDAEMVMTLPISLLLFVVVWKSGPKAADFVPEDDKVE
ncbi:hypothetical protein [Candidatus Palauibacter soopunensis]|uniref:hypothetical protein n=1 Tax=Candidatus Palauibacter soopunensis TaxID=3056739 RepID=UPI002394545C|nr:hypothetical protein [Candidatus Palauibacter soopunensis]MDE2878705.1 hypothetical protein [Candidatus Palauibacter soopunensis]